MTLDDPKPRRAAWIGALLLVAACTDAGPGDAPRIRQVVPDVVDPGGLVRILGSGFGEAGEGRHVAIGGRPLAAERWHDGDVRVRLPVDLPGGATFVVVVRDGVPSAPAALTVGGNRPPAGGPRRFPDGGPSDGGLPPLDAGPIGADAGPPLSIEFQPDPGGTQHVTLVAASVTGEELVLEVRRPQALDAVWGAAFHVTWDQNLLAFVDALPAAGDTFVAEEIAAGRLAVGRVLGSDRDPVLATLRFRVVGRGEGRVDVPARFRVLRDADNRDLPGVEWATGSIRIRELAP